MIDGLARRAPTNMGVTDYDRQHIATYFRLHDASTAGANWRDAARDILQLDPDVQGSRAIWQSHLDRARWMVQHGWRHLAVGSAD